MNQLSVHKFLSRAVREKVNTNMDSQIPNIDEAGANVLSSVDSVGGQEMIADIDIENIKNEIVGILSNRSPIQKYSFFISPSFRVTTDW